MKRITVLGATGSIGQNTIDLIRRAPDNYDVIALTGATNIKQLIKDAKDLRADIAVTSDETRLSELRDGLAGTGIEAAAGDVALIEAAARPVDWIMSAIVGFAGLAPGLEALKHGTTLALANKESLVTAGPLLMGKAKRLGATVLPVDSEHSAVFQALIGEDIAAVERVIITASGGAFRDYPIDALANVTVAQASQHPNWDMGQRITIDSATMFNKAMELIETKEFFDVSASQIETIIHPESLIHALVGFNDGALMAHVGPHDMRHAIGFALNYPDRKTLPVERLDLAKIGQLNFRAPDPARYPALAIADQVMAEGGLSGAVFNAAKEQALDHFIAGDCGFTDMARVVQTVLDVMLTREGLQNATITLDSVREADAMARALTSEEIADTKG
ncbi:1-deoxy-D-xylulose-5-phosphate reductoisomerase [Octadecabacter sp. 1_MG-2023]|uniref:1-deoxy-D-xylulose-5-phosphate reductoisomerase n=1 Tax=unclassified Octadecabacter TaxID=196158 RepID=UPI001C086717|nr:MULTISPECIES: 1-deoxy-D-xylulose-5-phosphate reductoisomerase [unclassified Octadecabacter]MBU2993208.1 1-deoxy-D-xylulose-5-phosphate reductoisomerase [Octadecabacter sp. B2R22]MDO6733339.1 1-deoxy-D-xylulose-5-phosphate reductoisomerase [Octadecabacter sp. 1_MG-2023]